MSLHTLTTRGEGFRLNDAAFLPIGLRCSNALISDDTTGDLIDHLDAGGGYFFASTWLQAPPPQGPNCDPGGYGGRRDPGMRWWLEFVRDKYGMRQMVRRENCRLRKPG